MTGARALLGVAALAIAACGARPPPAVLADVARVHDVALANGTGRFAPQAFAEAEGLGKEARNAWDGGDDVGTALTGERALAAYDRARALARLARAEGERSRAADERARQEDELRRLSATRAELVRDAAALEKQLVVATGIRFPPPSGPADASREAARLVSARSLAVQARLLCGAAHLLVPSLTGLADAERAVADLEKSLDGGHKRVPLVSAGPAPAPIDDAGTQRAVCLDALTRARRATDARTIDGDALLTELSAASAAGAAGWQPSRDERGVVVTLRDAFSGERLASAASARLEELGRIAAAHPGIGVQVVVHDSREAKAGDERAALASKAVVAGGAASGTVQAQWAGTHSPVVDPSDAKNRGRNVRLEVVLVTR